MAAALAIAPFVVTAGPAAAADPATTTVLSSTFDDGSSAPWFANGGATLAVVPDPDGSGQSLQVSNITHDYDGAAVDLVPLLTPGVQYTISVKARLADASQPAGTAHFTVDDGSYAWVASPTALTADAWTTITGTYTLPTGLTKANMYLNSGSAPFPVVLLDDITITAPGTDCGGGGGDTCTYPTTDQVISSDFESGADGWVGRDDGNGTATVAVVDGGRHGDDHALSATNREGQGQGVGHDVTCVLQPGQTYLFTGWVRFADGQPTDDVWLSLAATTGGTTKYSTLGQFTNVTNSGWAQVTQKFTMPAADSALLYVETKYYSDGSAGNTSDLLFDDLSVTKVTATIQDITPIKDTLPFPVGAAVSSAELVGAPGQLLAKHFNQVTPENYMKPEAWYDADHNFVTTNTEADALMQFAQDNDLRVYGHNLVWYQQTPDWFFQGADGTFLTNSATDQQIMRDRLKTHIDDVAKYLSDKFGKFGSASNPLVSFDVVNEVVSDNAGDPEGLRQSHWYQILGDEYIKDAFQDANEAFNGTYADASASHPIALFINDYNTEQPGKRQRLLDLVDSLISQGVPVDGVGHQFHVTMATPLSSLKDAIDAFNGIETADGHELYQAVTELDVPTGTPVTQANEIDQGYYYQGIFDMLRAEYASGASIFSATVWGLTDGQSWRASAGAPLLFDDDLQAKPAYYGVTDGTLPPRQRSAIVFQQGASDVDVTSPGATSDLEWSKLPLHAIDDSSGFQLRWSPDHLTAYVTVDDATPDATDAATFTYGAGLTATITRSGVVTGAGVTGVATTTADGWQAVVDLPESPALASGGSATFDVSVTNGAVTDGWNTPGTLGTLTLVEPLSFTTIPEATTAPTIDGTKDAIWDTASTVTTGKLISGAADGATATVYQLWQGQYLYVLADVTDPTIDSSSPNAYEQDSVEIFTDPGNAKNGGYRTNDAQMRIGADNAVSFGAGDSEANQSARLQHAATIVPGHGYVVEARIDLGVDQAGVGAFEGVDYEVNDGTAGARTSNHGWAEQTGNAYQTTSRWGVAQLVGPPVPPAAAPVVTGQPAATSVALGATATFTAAASGSPAPIVAWQRRLAGQSHWTTIAGATGTSLAVTATASVDGARYRAVFTNDSGTATTDAARLTIVRTKPVVTTQPASVTVEQGARAVFTAQASGYPVPSVSWQRQDPGARGWTTIRGERSTTLVVRANPSVDGTRYRAVFTNPLGSATTSVATLSLLRAKPVVTTQPASVTVASGGRATFTAQASGSPAPTVAWQRQLAGSRSWTTIGGARSTTLVVTASRSLDGSKYRAVFTNRWGTATTSAATLTVRAVKPVITGQPSSVTVRTLQLATFHVTATGPGLHYQWSVRAPGARLWAPAFGGTGSTLTLVGLPGASGTQVRVVVSNADGSVTSSTATLTVRR